MMGLWFDEIEAGLRSDLGRYVFSREAMLAFATAYDPQPFHIDDEAAKASYFGALAASGWHTAAAWMKCFVAANEVAKAALAAAGRVAPELGPSPGFVNLKWLRPVHARDVVSFSATVTGKRELASNPNWGLVTSRNEGINQRGELVFSFEGKVLVARRQWPPNSTSV